MLVVNLSNEEILMEFTTEVNLYANWDELSVTSLHFTP